MHGVGSFHNADRVKTDEPEGGNIGKPLGWRQQNIRSFLFTMQAGEEAQL